ncbi:MAG: hypothetical protein H0V17_34850 [Deltaproteobacteria bacterium]|nr:hypothetical protein [Deltaproteobacteria bacterium]
MSTVAIGCGKKKEGDGGDTKTTDKTDKGAPASDLPALTADPEPAKITPAETPPADSVKWRMLAKRGKGGWPTFDAYNLGTKPIGFMPIYGYAYDKDGKQLARTKVPLSWNGKIDPGDKTSFSIDLGADDVPVTAAATTFQLCFTSIQFVGDADSTNTGECPDQRPKK